VHWPLGDAALLLVLAGWLLVSQMLARALSRGGVAQVEVAA
jgi:hypothetical protein